LTVFSGSDQGHQPAQHLQRPPGKTGPLGIRALLVVATGHSVKELVVHPDAIGLLMMLSLTEILDLPVGRFVAAGSKSVRTLASLLPAPASK